MIEVLQERNTSGVVSGQVLPLHLAKRPDMASLPDNTLRVPTADEDAAVVAAKADISFTITTTHVSSTKPSFIKIGLVRRPKSGGFSARDFGRFTLPRRLKRLVLEWRLKRLVLEWRLKRLVLDTRVS
jgi:hypothetical protein